MKDRFNYNSKSFLEKGTFPRFDSAEFKKLQQSYGPQLITDFFVNRLIGKNGLMNRQNRDDFIYLNGDIDNTPRSNGKTGQQNFDNDLFTLRLQVSAKENPFQNSTSSNNQKGKTYVISDVHGMYYPYAEVMKRMTPKDHLIILGDVIDRGTSGIQILQDIIKRKKNQQTNPEITFMLGNHEMQFLEAVSAITKRQLDYQDILTIINTKKCRTQYNFWSLHNSSKSKSNQLEWKAKLDKYEPLYKKLIAEKNLKDSELELIGNWLNENKGMTTLLSFLILSTTNATIGRISSVEEQNTIFQFLKNSYVVMPQNINGKDYLFVHAVPPNDTADETISKRI